MKLVANIKLDTTLDQARALKRTLETCNKACDYISKQAFETKVFGQFKLHNGTTLTLLTSVTGVTFPEDQVDEHEVTTLAAAGRRKAFTSVTA